MIKELKKQLYEVIKEHGINSDEVLFISQSLDRIIAKEQKRIYECYKISQTRTH